jgi:DNA polymerase I-like protein with 3'-5' exonuclease and polymerase domains
MAKVKKEKVTTDDLKKVKKKKVVKLRDIRTMFREILAELSAGGGVAKVKKDWMSKKAFEIVDTPEALQKWVDEVLTNAPRFEFYGFTEPVVALDTEDVSLDTRLFIRMVKLPDGSYHQEYEIKTDISGICLSADGVKGIYIPITHEFQDLALTTPARNIDRRICAEILQPFFNQVHLVFYNGKFDREVMRLTMGIVFRPYPHFEDVQVLQYIDDPKADMEDKQFYTGDSGGLKALSSNLLGIEQIELEEIAKVKADTCPHNGSPFCSCTLEQKKENKHGLKQHFVPFSWIPVDIALYYAASDAICTWLLWEKLHPLARTRKTVHRIDHELVDSITWIERQRFLIDTDRHTRTVKGHQRVLAQFQKKLYDLAIAAGYKENATDDGVVLPDDRFNPDSNDDLRILFFDVKGYAPLKMTDGGKSGVKKASCDAEVVEDLHKLHPEDEFLEVFSDYKSYISLHPSSLHYDPSDGTARIYLKQNVVAGGRLSSAGGDFYKDGGFGLNSQAVKKVEGYLMWKVTGNVLIPDEIPEDQIEPHTEEELHPSCFREVEEEETIFDDIPERDRPRLTLTDEEVALMKDYAQQRLDTALKEKRKNYLGRDSLLSHYIGVCGEYVPTKWLEIRYDFTNGTYRTQPDFVYRDTPCEGRCSHKMSELKVKDSDEDSRLVVNSNVIDKGEDWPRVFEITGWVYAHEGKNKKFKKDPGDVGRPAYWVPEIYTREPELLKKGEFTAPLPTLSSFSKKKIKVRKQAPGIIHNHIGQYMGYTVCLVPGCQTCKDKFGFLIENGKIDANQRVNLRCLFYSPPGWTFFTVDYGNIEMRAAANCSGEPEFINEFLHGKGDFHSLTASKVFPEFSDPKSPNYRAKHLRDLAKIINFALLYGGTAYTIYENMKKQDPNITFQRCEEMVENYWKGVPVFFEFCQRKQAIARDQLICTTTTNRVIKFDSAMKALHIHVPNEEEKKNLWQYRDYMKKSKELKEADDPRWKEYLNLANSMWKNPDTGVRNAMDYSKFMGKIQRVSVNAPIQGLCGDFMRMSLNKIRQWVEADPLIATIFMLHCSVHDEIDFSVKNEYVPFVLPRITRMMKLRKLHQIMKWQVPIEADAEYGPSWDVEHHVTGDDDHIPAAWTRVSGMDRYLPGEWDSATIKNLIKAISSQVEARVEKAKAFLKENLHERAFQAAWWCFNKKKGKKEVVPQTDPKEIQRALIAAIQLDEFWRIDNMPDEDDAKLETLEQYETRMGLGPADRNPAALIYGPLGSLPLDAPVKRYVPEPLKVEISWNSPQEASEGVGGTQGTLNLFVAAENLPVAPPEPTVAPPVVDSTPEVPETKGPPPGVTVYDISGADQLTLMQIDITLGKGDKSVWVLHDGIRMCLHDRAIDHIPEHYLKKPA